MVAAEFGVSFVERDGEDVTIVCDRDERAVEECFDFEFRARTAEREVAQPQLIDGETDFLAGAFSRTSTRSTTASPHAC